MENKETQKRLASLQDQMDIIDIKRGAVTLKDGSLRGVLAVSSINFELKSQQEQEAIIYGYQQFLNTLDFSTQILVSSKKFDIDPYLDSLERKKRITLNPMLKEQIIDYIEFIRELSKISNIMSTFFYVVVPFYPIEQKKQSLSEKIFSIVNHRKAIYQRRESFEICRKQLFLRMEQVRSSLVNLGLEIEALDTDDLIELFYNFFNSSEFEYNQMEELGELQLERN